MKRTTNKIIINNKIINIITIEKIKKKNFFSFFNSSIYSLLNGMKVTLNYFITIPWSKVTREYPENRNTMVLSNRFRARLFLISESLESPNYCTGCKICEKMCPNNSIIITAGKGLSKRTELIQFIWRMDICTFCNACVLSCPFNALEMDPNFEIAVYNKKLLIYNLNKYSGPTEKYFKKMKDSVNKKKLMKPLGTFENIKKF